jgi:hypothetical protein
MKNEKARGERGGGMNKSTLEKSPEKKSDRKDQKGKRGYQKRSIA